MTTKREKDESEPRVPVVVVCTPPQPIPAPLPMLMIKSSSLDSRTTSPVVKSDLGLLREVTRCSGSGCKKRVGLMRFRCRCGDVFRYSDRHHCTYDYKAAGRDNPLVRATKLLKV